MYPDYNNPVYKFYINEEFVAQGTVDELSDALNLSKSSIRNYLSNPSKTRRVERVDRYLKLGQVDNLKIRQLLKEFGYNQKELSDILGISHVVMFNRLSDKAPWRITEVYQLEDLFYLEDGELFKEADTYE